MATTASSTSRVAPPALAPTEFGLLRLSGRLRQLQSVRAPGGGGTLGASTEPRPLLLWLHGATTFDALQRALRRSLDGVAAGWHDPLLQVLWRYDSLASAPPTLDGLASRPKPLVASIELRGMWSEPAADAAPPLRVGWVLGLALHAGCVRT